ncbi:hypothetical protein LG204_05165 [Methylovorus menthalis]|uniref:hypothetical protein n=1 Tax=Methylovorus menthalis TaxID=1002227 RepID=UPI001E3894E7|nr:hypothetical protein [Methylovorus menthalis]MCB4810701.1 hypothetical protein [Methylovorus menthalis]
MLRRIFLTVSLVFLFAFGQQSAAVHEISHYTDILSQKQDASPHGGFCDKCLSFGELAAGLQPTIHAIPVVPFSQSAWRDQSTPFHPAFSSHFSARAPPSIA